MELIQENNGRMMEFYFGGGSMTGRLAHVPYPVDINDEGGGTWGVVTYRGRWIDLEDCEGWRFIDC
jgi:hypothetical protein